MAEQKIGSCSLCGGDAVAWLGAWGGSQPPPPKCVKCGAILNETVINMVKSKEESNGNW